MALATLIDTWDTILNGIISLPETLIQISAEGLQVGEPLYADNCSFCHGGTGQGGLLWQRDGGN